MDSHSSVGYQYCVVTIQRVNETLKLHDGAFNELDVC